MVSIKQSRYQTVGSVLEATDRSTSVNARPGGQLHLHPLTPQTPVCHPGAVNSDLEARVQALETAVERLLEDGAATRVIAAMADRDTAEIRTTHRATTGVLNALRETQLEQGQTLQTLAGAVAGLTTQVVDLDAKVTALADGQAHHGQRLDQITALVASLADGQAEILRRLPAAPDQG